MYMIAVFALIAFAVVSYMFKRADEEEDMNTDAENVYSTRMSTREWFDQRYVPCALEASVLVSIPMVRYGCQTASEAALMASTSCSACAVCLTVFQQDEELKVLPPCRHAFHPSCIDPWFETHSTCPTCRSEVTCPTAKKWEDGDMLIASRHNLIHAATVEIIVG